MELGPLFTGYIFIGIQLTIQICNQHKRAWYRYSKFNITIKTNHTIFIIPFILLLTAVGEPPLQASCSVMFAIRQALRSGRAEAGLGSAYFDMGE